MVRLLLLLLLGYATADCGALVGSFGENATNCNGILDTFPCATSCLSGYSLVGNPMSYTCNGTTYDPAPGNGNCLMDCGAHPLIANVSRSAGNCTFPVPTGTPCMLSCAGGYGNAGDQNVLCTNGTWSDPNGTCTACAMNMFSDGSTDCQACPNLSVTQGTTSASCVCPLGTSWSGSTDNCILCTPGTYNDMFNQSSCTSCGGFNQSAQGSDNVTDCFCPAGFNGPLCAFACPAQSYNPSINSACKSCGGGALANGTQQTFCFCDVGFGMTLTPSDPPCTACPMDTFQPVLSGQDPSCTACPSGSHTDSIGSACCNGYYQSSGTCLTCDPVPFCNGTIRCTSTNDETCDECQRGYVPTPFGYPTSTCQECAAGQYRDSPTSLTCASCGSPPATSLPGAEGLNECYCPSGLLRSVLINTISCQPCLAGTYFNNVTLTCDVCDAGGHATSAVGSTDPSQCSCINGYGRTGAPPTLCSQCMSNEYTNATTNLCTACPAGSSPNGNLNGCICNNPLQFNPVTGVCEVPVYYWQPLDWYLCNGQCGRGASLRMGDEERALNCYQKIGTMDMLVGSSSCSQLPQPATQRACTQACPPVPQSVSAMAYYQSVVVNFTLPSPLYVVLLPRCNATSPCIQGLCDTASGECRAAIDGFLAESEDGVYQAYKPLSLMDGIAGILVPNVPNGKSVRFSVRAVTVAIQQRDFTDTLAVLPLRSDASSFSNSVTPQATLGCAVNCNHGICIDGSCKCDPGYYGATCMGTAMILISNPTTVSLDTTSRFPIAYSLTPATDLYTGSSNNVDIYVYESKCKDLDYCVPMTYSLGASAVSTYTVVINSNYKVGSSYFVRVFFSGRNNLFNDSDTFTVATDSLCSVITCLNGGSCSYGFCSCTGTWSGPTCSVDSKSCSYTPTYCNFGTCNPTSNRCDCATGWSGDRCNYPVGCDLRCQNGGILNIQDGLLFDCTACVCPTFYSGKDCGICEADCANGGKLKSCSDITYSSQPCTCPDFWDGPTCLTPYISLKFKLDVGSNNIDSTNDFRLDGLISSEISRALGNPSSSDWRVYEITISGDSIWVEVRFYNAPNGLLLRERLAMVLADPSSTLYARTATISNAQPADQPTQNTPSFPPDDDSNNRDWFLPVVIVVPIIGFIILIVLIYVIAKNCSGGGSSSGGTQDVPMATRS